MTVPPNLYPIEKEFYNVRKARENKIQEKRHTEEQLVQKTGVRSIIPPDSGLFYIPLRPINHWWLSSPVNMNPTRGMSD